MLRLLFLVALLLVGVGLFRGWFQVTSSSSQNKLNIGITVENEKIDSDAKQVRETVNDLGDRAKAP